MTPRNEKTPQHPAAGFSSSRSSRVLDVREPTRRFSSTPLQGSDLHKCSNRLTARCALARACTPARDCQRSIATVNPLVSDPGTPFMCYLHSRESRHYAVPRDPDLLCGLRSHRGPLRPSRSVLPADLRRCASPSDIRAADRPTGRLRDTPSVDHPPARRKPSRPLGDTSERQEGPKGPFPRSKPREGDMNAR